MFFLKNDTGRGNSKTVHPPEGLETLEIVRSNTARRVALRVDPARGRICLVIPKRGSEKKAWRFADENREWIEQHLAELETPVPFVDGAIIPIFGKDRVIQITKTTSRITTITLSDTTLHVETARDDASTNIKKFLRKQFEETVWPMIREKSAVMGREVPSLQLRDTRARWGSCAPDGRLMFCWRLVFAPMNVIDYVVGHECAHLKHMNHSDAFWQACDSLCDDMNFARDWLRQNGDRLLSYGAHP